MQGSGPLQRLYPWTLRVSPRLGLQGSVLAGLPIPNTEQFNPTFWHIHVFEQPFLQVQVMLWKHLEHWKHRFWSEQRGIPRFGWQGESICSVSILISIALVTPEIGGLFEWRVNPWSGAIWLIWTVLAKAKTTTTHRLKFWNTFLGSGDLKTDVKNLTLVFSRSLRYTFSIHTSSKKIISPF